MTMSGGLEDLLAPMLSEAGVQGEGIEGAPVPEGRGTLVGDDQAPTYERASVDLTEEEAAALKALVQTIEQTDDTFCLEEIRPALERREGFNGRQLLAWDPGERRYVDVVRQIEDETEADQDIPSFHKDNFFAAYGLDFVALMIAQAPVTTFSPGNPSKPADMTAARQGERFVEHLRKENDDLTLRRWIALYFWTDGFGAIYTRMRADRSRFGFDLEPEITLEPGMVSPGGLCCIYCGGVSGMESQECEGCGLPLVGAAPIPPDFGLVPHVSRLLEVPRASIVKSCYGICELRRTPGARTVRECGYLILGEEIPRAHAKSLYPEKADQISGRTPAGLGEDFAAAARRSLTYGSAQPADHLVTNKRVWLRPWQLAEVGTDELRKQLEQKFAEGLLLVFMDGILCEAFNESMDDHWTFRFAEPSSGSDVLACGSTTWDLQQTANELLNIRIEGARQGIPALIANNDILDADAFAAGRVQPGLIYSGKTPSDGGSLRDAVVPTPTANLPAEVAQLENELGGARAQHRSGIVPALWGGKAGGAGNTLGGYRLMRDQAQMRHGIPQKEMDALSHESNLQAVKLYARDGWGDVEVVDKGEGGQWSKEVISIDDLKGEIRIESDDDASFPMGPAERRAMWLEYAANDRFAPLLMTTLNEGMTAESLGLRDLKLPGQEARETQRKEIEQLLQGEPWVGQDGGPSSSVPVDVELEDHDAHAGAIELWANSTDGARTRDTNPAGWANVKAHWQEHMQAKGRKALMVQLLQAPPLPPGMNPAMNPAMAPPPAMPSGQ
ncbi:MAG: hypothetical protein HY814_14275 [Candidatus Riflebacteria bacterium]|nr:hypothetical protein [Candidatus Riflebacteria bacterium]